MAFEITTVQAGPAADITLSGALDASAFDRFEAEMLALEASAVAVTTLVLRMRDLGYLSSAGIRALLRLMQRRGSAMTIYVVAPQAGAVDTIKRCGLLNSVVILDDYPATTA